MPAFHRLEVTTLLFVAGCGEGRFCTLEARYSVDVTVVDDGGGESPDVVVRALADDGTEAPCVGLTPGGPRSFWGCGVEQPGDFAISASAVGRLPQSAEARAEPGECHVVPGDPVTLELACDDPPALILQILTPDWTDAVNPMVSCRVDGGLAEIAEPADRWWRCGHGRGGNWAITVVPSEDLPTRTEVVLVPEDGCGPETAFETILL
jgi:hypothetical protein